MRTILVCFTLVAISIPALSQEKQGIIERDQKGIICSVEFSEKDNLAPQSAEDFFSSYLGINRQDNFEKTSSKSKRADFIHEHYDQYYKGVKVEGGGYNFHYRDNKMYFANGHYVNVESIVATPSVTSNDAIKDFLLYKGIDESEVTNVINELFIKEVQEKGSGDLAIKLVYRLYLESDNINNNEVGFVDAHMGGVITTEPRTTDVTGTFATRYSGSRQAETAIDPINGGYRLYDNTRGTVIHTRSLQNNTTNLSSAVELNDNNNNWTAAEHATSKNDMGLDVHWTLQKLYDYLYATHGINSFDDAGRSINAYVRYGINHDNAHWDPTLKVLYFGQGSTIFNPLASFDAVAHEFGHGITDFQIGWSGSDINKRAFHEGMSDIWGAILEQRIRPNSTWKIGEQITKTKPHLRNLQKY
jgi:bacillolysin